MMSSPRVTYPAAGSCTGSCGENNKDEDVTVCIDETEHPTERERPTMKMNRRPIAQVNAMYLIVMLSALCFASPAGGEDVKPVSRTGDAPMQCLAF